MCVAVTGCALQELLDVLEEEEDGKGIESDEVSGGPIMWLA